jgi:hypothetical protein
LPVARNKAPAENKFPPHPSAQLVSADVFALLARAGLYRNPRFDLQKREPCRIMNSFTSRD